MANKIVWSKKADVSFDRLTGYLEQEWTQKEVAAFVTRVYEKIDILSVFPQAGFSTKRSNIYKTLVHKKIILIYQYKPVKKEVLLIVFWNNLQNPERLKY